MEELSIKALDHGFYYDDEDLKIIVAPIEEVGSEWRFVVVNGRIIASSVYEADGRNELAGSIPQAASSLALEIANELAPPEAIYVLDVCQCGDELRLMELNPFSGADLYACDRAAIVSAIAQLAHKLQP